MKIFKLIILSILFLILLLPASCSTWWSVNEVLGKNTYVNPAYKDSSFYTTDDEIGFITQYCKENNLPNWHNWNIDNWGTKWNAVVDDSFWVSELKYNATFRYDMRTAWADPRPIIIKMLEKYQMILYKR